MSGSGSDFHSHLLAVFAYVFGCFSGVLLLIVERHDRYVRFHAMQSTLTVLVVFVAALICASIPVVGRLLTAFLTFGAGVVWFVLMFKAFTGQRYKLPYVGEFADRQIR